MRPITQEELDAWRRAKLAQAQYNGADRPGGRAADRRRRQLEAAARKALARRLAAAQPEGV